MFAECKVNLKGLISFPILRDRNSAFRHLASYVLMAFYKCGFSNQLINSFFPVPLPSAPCLGLALPPLYQYGSPVLIASQKRNRTIGNFEG